MALLLACFLATAVSFLWPGKDLFIDEWDGYAFETTADLWLVMYKTLEQYHASPFRTLKSCGDGTDDCNIPMHWKHYTRLFSSRDVALQWINREFARTPERFVSLRATVLQTDMLRVVDVETKTTTIEKTTWFDVEHAKIVPHFPGQDGQESPKIT